MRLPESSLSKENIQILADIVIFLGVNSISIERITKLLRKCPMRLPEISKSMEHIQMLADIVIFLGVNSTVFQTRAE